MEGTIHPELHPSMAQAGSVCSRRSAKMFSGRNYGNTKKRTSRRQWRFGLKELCHGDFADFWSELF